MNLFSLTLLNLFKIGRGENNILATLCVRKLSRDKLSALNIK
jgi:hypothetical protein